MQDELQTENKKSSREMWLFLIFLDLVATCIFGFFIYKSFFAAPHQSDAEAQKPAPALEDVLVEDIKSAPEQDVVLTPPPAAEKPAQEQQPAAAPAVQPQAEQPKEAAVKEEPKTEVKEVKEVKKEEPKKEAAKKEEVKAEPKKAEAKKQQSVFVANNGKTRKVTFKYFGAGKKVAVVGGFTMSKPVAMKKNGKEWSTTVFVAPGTYKYVFVVDGKTILDPNGKADAGKSVFTAK